MKKCYRFFWSLTGAQARWLNRMADKGFRLARTEKLLYGFEPCRPGQYRYCVEFVGHKSRAGAEDYASFLEGCGYRVFFKNINLNWNVGKVEARPWAEKGGRLASNATTYNRELLIVEKENDGKPFELHTTYEDKVRYYKDCRRPALFLLVMMAAVGIWKRSWAAGAFALLALALLVRYQIALVRLGRQAKEREW